MITPTAKGNYASSMFDQRTKFSKAQTPRSLDIADATQRIQSRPEPVYEHGDTIRLEDGSLRKVSFRTWSESQKMWLYRLTTTQRSQYNGIISTGNLTEQQVKDMDKSNTVAVDSQQQTDGWIVEYRDFTQDSEWGDFVTWKNSDGKAAIFDKEIAIQFAQGMVMAYDFYRIWAIFRVLPCGDVGQEPYWFCTLIQPDRQYTAALSAFADRQHSNLAVGLATFYQDGFPTLYTFNRVGSYFVRRVIESWRKEYETDSCTGYSNPNRPRFNERDILKLPTDFMRKVEFITPYWIQPGQVGFKYWFYVQGKQLVSYAQDELTPTDVEMLEVEFAPAPKADAPLATFAQTDLQEQRPVQCVLEKMQKDIDFKDHTIERLKDVLNDIEKACKNLSVNLDDDFSWIGFMANMGLNGGYYSDGLKARFGIVPKPQHDYSLIRDEI